MIRGLRFVSVAVPDLQEAERFFREALGLRLEAGIEQPHHSLRVVRLRAGESGLALLEPSEPHTPVGRFLQQRGGAALYHLAFEVEDLELAMRTVLARGGELLDREPRPAMGGRVAFVRPRGQPGLLIELWEPARPPAEPGGPGAQDNRILPPEGEPGES